MPPKRASSASETPLPSTEPNPADASSLPEEEWTAMQDILDAVYDYRTAEFVSLKTVKPNATAI